MPAAPIAAARKLAARLGLPDSPPVLLKDGSNVLVGMGAVVARVATATATARPDAAAWLARDVALARFARAQGTPAVGPCDEPPPGPHHQDGFAITLWPYTQHDPSRVPAPAEAGALLAELHGALEDYPGELPDDGPMRDIDAVLGLLDARDAPADTRTALRVRARATLAAADRAAGRWPARPLHGDAHPGNILCTPDGPRWIDFEDTWRGPIAWDLAVLSRTSLLPGAEAVAAYPNAPSPAELAPFVELRELQGVCWRLVLARRFPERRGIARAALGDYLGR